MDNTELDAIKGRMLQVQNLEWMKRYASDETQQLLFEDLPKLVELAEKTIDGSNTDKKSKTNKRPRSNSRT